jgi:hypothetical protein
MTETGGNRRAKDLVPATSTKNENNEKKRQEESY